MMLAIPLKSWILKDKTADIKLLLWRQDQEDKSVEDENDTTIVTTDYVYLIQLLHQSFDTLKRDNTELLKTLNKLVEN